MIEATGLSRVFARKTGDPVTALKDVSFAVGAGEFVTVRGSSGSGKSTLLNILGCLDTPSAGRYRLAGEDVSAYTDQQRSQLRARSIGFVFQQFNLLPRTTALENVEVPAQYSGRAVDRTRALRILERVGLAQRAQHFVAELSGGEQQRVAVARALMNDPPLLLADEPTGNLDAASGAQVMQLLSELNDEGRTIVLVTHDEQIARFARREILLRDGSIESDRATALRPQKG